MIFAFDHKHKPGDICGPRTCEHARMKPSLVGAEVFSDLTLCIVREATREEYLSQGISEGWYIPPLPEGYFLYEITTD